MLEDREAANHFGTFTWELVDRDKRVFETCGGIEQLKRGAKD
jgi:hypothetical protein